MDHAIVFSLMCGLVACASGSPPPAAPTQAYLMVPVEPIGVDSVDEASFMKLLQQDDWTQVIDPAVGLVSLTENTSSTNTNIHEVSVHRFCGNRAAQWAKVEALDLAAGRISDGQPLPCLGFRELDAPTLAIECHDRSGGLKNFWFVRRGSRFVLAGVASVAEGSVSPRDEQRYHDALAATDQCDLATGRRKHD